MPLRSSEHPRLPHPGDRHRLDDGVAGREEGEEVVGR